MKNTLEIIFRKKRQLIVGEGGEVINHFFVRYDSFIPNPQIKVNYQHFALKQVLNTL